MKRSRKIWRFTACLCIGLCFLLGVEHTSVNAASVTSQNARPVPISTVEYNSLSQVANTAKLGEIRCGDDANPMFIAFAVIGILCLVAAAYAKKNSSSSSN